MIKFFRWLYLIIPVGCLIASLQCYQSAAVYRVYGETRHEGWTTSWYKSGTSSRTFNGETITKDTMSEKRHYREFEHIDVGRLLSQLFIINSFGAMLLLALTLVHRVPPVSRPAPT